MIKNTYFAEMDISRLVAEEELSQLNLSANIIEEAGDYVDLERFTVLAMLKPSSVMIY
jgi:hypothetical protein